MANRRTPDPTRAPKPATSATPAKSPAKSTQPPAEPKAETKAAKPASPTPAGSPAVAPAATAQAAPSKRVVKPKRANVGITAAGPQVSEETRRAMIAESAYLRAERRGFAPGGEVEDWCEAEKEVDALLNAGTGAGPQ